MGKYTVVYSDDPVEHRESIFEFWKEYLPGTPPERLEWMTRGNPAGPAIWFFAIAQDSSEVAGIASLLPRNMWRRGKTYRAGIMGDFMIHKKHRAFGPNILLPKTIIAHLEKLGFDFMYTLPNAASHKICQRIGLKRIKEISTYMRPVTSKSFLNKYIPTVMVDVCAPILDTAMRITSRETFTRAKGIFEEVDEIDDSFNLLWEKVKLKKEALITEMSSAYLTWRYVKNPFHSFRFITYKTGSDEDLSGFAAFCTTARNNLELYDIVAMERRSRERLIKKMIEVASSEQRDKIYFISSRPSKVLDGLRSFRFIDVKDNVDLYCETTAEVNLESWEFSNADRNI
jgi:hypothetical protein